MKQLLKFVTKAEKAGFSSTIASDHFHPWWHDNAFGNFTWVWIAAAAERTKKMQFITGVTAPIYRYHPAIIAQAFASLDTKPEIVRAESGRNRSWIHQNPFALNFDLDVCRFCGCLSLRINTNSGHITNVSRPGGSERSKDPAPCDRNWGGRLVSLQHTYH